MPTLDDLVSTSIRALTAYHTPSAPPPIKLDANEGPDVLTPAERERLSRAFSETAHHRYPDLSAAAVRRALARHLGAQEPELVMGVGSDEVIGMMMRAFSEPRAGRDRASALFLDPSFVMYGVTARAQGLAPVPVALSEDRFDLEVDAVRDAIAEHRPNLVFLASPNNPTGNDFGDDALRAVVEAAPDALVVLDEAYAPFMRRTRVDWLERYPHVAVLGTLSKVGFAALRFGWVRLAAPLAAQLEKVRPPYNLNAPTQHAVRVVLEEMGDAMERVVAMVEAERARVSEALRRHDGLEVYRSDANFVLVRHDDAERLHAGLLARGIGVRRFGAPRLAHHLRITIGTPDENTALLEAVAAVA